MDLQSSWLCGTCGKRHQGVPLDWAYDAPLYWEEQDQATRDQGKLDADLCQYTDADGDHYFARSVIEIPILESSESFCFGVWGSLSLKSFKNLLQLWGKPESLTEPPYFSWLSNRIKIFPDTLNLKMNLQVRDVSQRPFARLEPTEHPLAIAQHQGIAIDELRLWTERLLHQ